MAVENNHGDEIFGRVFGEHTGIDQDSREQFDRIRNNDPLATMLVLHRDAAEIFSDRAWKLLGHYIARNDHLESIFPSCLTDENMPLFFKHLTGSSSLKKIFFSRHDFGVNGIQSMVPFLSNSSLTELHIHGNANINAECFRLLMNGLRGGSIEVLDASGCSIEDIMALEDCSLPHIKKIDLANNNIKNIPSLEKYTNPEHLLLQHNSIGREGCKSIAKLLMNHRSKLRCLSLRSNNIGDKEAEIIANSLKHNNKLTSLYLEENDIKEDGRRAFLKLLIDVSSIDRAYNSNQTLSELRLQDSRDPIPILFTDDEEEHFEGTVSEDATATELEKYIDWAIRINKGKEEEEDESGSEDEEDDYSYEENSIAAGSEKVITFQLDSKERMILCRLQGIDYCYNSLLADIDPVLLPDILSIVGGEHGQNELYRMLIASVSDLASIVNRKVALRERIAENIAQIDALNAEHMRKIAEHMRNVAAIDAENLELKRELESIESGAGEHQMMANTKPSSAKLCGKKRDRSAS